MGICGCTCDCSLQNGACTCAPATAAAACLLSRSVTHQCRCFVLLAIVLLSAGRTAFCCCCCCVVPMGQRHNNRPACKAHAAAELPGASCVQPTSSHAHRQLAGLPLLCFASNKGAIMQLACAAASGALTPSWTKDSLRCHDLMYTVSQATQLLYVKSPWHMWSIDLGTSGAVGSPLRTTCSHMILSRCAWLVVD